MTSFYRIVEILKLNTTEFIIFNIQIFGINNYLINEKPEKNKIRL